MRRTKILLFLFASLLVTAHVASASEQVIWEQGKNLHVKLVDASNQSFMHPATIDNQEIAAFFSQVKVFDKSENKSIPLFSDKQVQSLIDYLPSALATANSNQRVIFALSKKKSSMAGLMQREYYTAGSIFIDQQGLNLVIGDLDRERDYGYEAAYDPTKQGLVKYDFNYGVGDQKPKKKAKTINLSLEPMPEGVSTRSGSLTIALATLDELPKRSAQTQASLGVAANSLSRQEVKQMISEKPSLSREEVEEIVNAAKSQNVEQSEPVQQAVEATLEERFKLLQTLKSQGLITEQEYQAKRKELLSQI